MKNDNPPSKPGSIIWNLDNNNGDGTHWTCSRVVDKNHPAYYFDSMGAVPPHNIEKYLRSIGNGSITYNGTQLQPISSNSCGYYCLYILDKLVNGKTYYEAIYSLNDKSINTNEELLRSWLKGLTKRK